MVRKNIGVILLFLLSFGLMEVHKLVPLSHNQLNLFINSDIKQTLNWYIKDSCNMLIMIITLFAFLLAIKKSFIKSLVKVMICFYSFDFIMYWYNYKQSDLIYISAYFLIFLSVIYLIYEWKNF